MRFPEPCRMSESDNTPVWARKKRRRSGGPPIVGLLVTFLALFGALTAVLGIKERSLAEGGAIVDGWITAGWNGARELVGQAPETAGSVADEAGAAAEKAGNALEAGADKAAEELRRP